MSLLTLPDTGYGYLSVVDDTGFELIRWDSLQSEEDNAQYWLDLLSEVYEPNVWWQFWKPCVTFKVFACGGTVDPFYQTIKLQRK